MFKGTQKVLSIEGDKVSFENGTYCTMNEKARAILLTEESIEDNEVEFRMNKALCEEIFKALAASDMSKSLTSDEKLQDQNQVDIAAKILVAVQEYDFPVNKIRDAFDFVKAILHSLGVLVQNNINTIDNKVMAKVLQLSDGKTDGEKLRNIRMSDYLKFLN